MDEDAELRRRAKALMRRRFRGQRMSLPASAIVERSRALCERLLGLDVVAAAARVALFWPIERYKEVDLRGADAALRSRGVVIAYPHIDASRHMTFRVASPEDMSMSELGFMAPPLDAAELDALDVIVVPGLAFDDRGYRIGYGAGFYDETLPRYCPPAVSVGVAFDFQLAVDIPETADDVPVQQIVTDRRILKPEA